MTVFTRVALAVAVLLLAAPSAFAQGTTVPNWQGLGAGIGMGVAALGIGVGLGLIGFSALAGIARQPEQAGKIQGAMILLAALVEGGGIVAMVLCLLIGARIMGG
jgi:F-type H+-transporting ATPase subunit c